MKKAQHKRIIDQMKQASDEANLLSVRSHVSLAKSDQSQSASCVLDYSKKNAGPVIKKKKVRKTILQLPDRVVKREFPVSPLLEKTSSLPRVTADVCI